MISRNFGVRDQKQQHQQVRLKAGTKKIGKIIDCTYYEAISIEKNQPGREIPMYSKDKHRHYISIKVGTFNTSTHGEIAISLGIK